MMRVWPWSKIDALECQIDSYSSLVKALTANISRMSSVIDERNKRIGALMNQVDAYRAAVKKHAEFPGYPPIEVADWGEL